MSVEVTRGDITQVEVEVIVMRPTPRYWVEEVLMARFIARRALGC